VMHMFMHGGHGGHGRHGGGHGDHTGGTPAAVAPEPNPAAKKGEQP
jgi:hypothetical protein